MSNSNGNVITRGLHGKFGDQVVFRVKNGNSITANVPNIKQSKPVGGQAEVRERFRMAAQWAKKVLTDPVQLAAYKAKAKNNMTAFSTAVADFLCPPKVTGIDTSGYSGHAGDIIAVNASDNFNIKEVSVMLCRADGTLIEKGACQADDSGNGWNYTCEKDNDTPGGMKITAVAIDNPGHTGTLTVTVA